ncbi:MAG: hypothetical protein AAGI08_16360 [Bacteroidota bacterium]
MKCWVIVLAVLLLPVTAAAQTPRLDLRFATESVEAGRLKHAETLLRGVAREGTPAERAVAYARLAELYATGPIEHHGRARRAIQRAVDLMPDSTSYKVQQLELWQAIGSDPPWISVPMSRKARREGLARRILDQDPRNAMALEELGSGKFFDFRVQFSAVSFVTGTLGDALLTAADTSFTFPPLDPSAPAVLREGRYAFKPLRDALVQRAGVYPISKQGAATQAFDQAESFFRRQVESAPDSPVPYRYLARIYLMLGHTSGVRAVAEQFVRERPDLTEAHLLAGLARHRDGDPSAAEAAFDTALDLMTEDERSEYVVDTSDPRLLTDADERQLERLSRIVYADLLLENRDVPYPGHESERGEVYLRYGEPVAYVQTSTPEDRIEVWDYGDLNFVFHDPGKTGHYVLYSPPAGGNPQLDFVLRARTAFRDRPERFEYEPTGTRVSFPFLTYAFQDGDGQNELVAALGIPTASTAGADADLQTGAFILDAETDLVRAERRHAWSTLDERILVDATVPLIVDAFELSVDQPEPTVAVEFDSGAGEYLGFERTIRTLPEAADGLSLSDLMPAYSIDYGDEAPLGRVLRAGHIIQPAPWLRFEAGEPLRLYAEAYGLTGRYEVEARLSPRGQDAAEPVSVSFNGSSVRATEPFALELDTSTLPAGTYRLTFTIRDLRSDQVAEQRLTVRLR